MWRSLIADTLLQDSKALKSQDLKATALALNYLYQNLENACTFFLGKESEILSQIQERPALFERRDLYSAKQIIELPTSKILLEYYKESDQKVAALILDHEASKRDQESLEMYIFRYDASKNRWLWPFLGLRYGPLEKDLTKIAVYEAEKLALLPEQTQNAMIKEHALDARIATAALKLVIQNRLRPNEGKLIKSKVKDSAKYPINPSSWDRRRRTQHQKGLTLKGSRRS